MDKDEKKKLIKFNPVINAGEIFNVLMMVATIFIFSFGVYKKMDDRITGVETRATVLENNQIIFREQIKRIEDRNIRSIDEIKSLLMEIRDKLDGKQDK